MAMETQLLHSNNDRIAVWLNLYISEKIKAQAKKEGIEPEQLIEIILHGYFEQLELE